MTNQDTNGPQNMKGSKDIKLNASTSNRPVYNRPVPAEKKGEQFSNPAFDQSKHPGQHGHKHRNIEHLEVDEDLMDEIVEEPKMPRDTSLKHP